MNEQVILCKTQNFVKEQLGEEYSGHNFFHIQRVVKLAQYIQNKEGGDPFIIEISAWLHDIGDYKLNKGIDMQEKMITDFLKSLELDKRLIKQIITVITLISFSKSFDVNVLSLEAKILQDADRLDAIGAIGIARTFAYSGNKGMPIFDPYLKPKTFHSTQEYKGLKTTSINHFHEKLLLLKDNMNTMTAKKIAKERHDFMLLFLDKFYSEWNFNQ